MKASIVFSSLNLPIIIAPKGETEGWSESSIMDQIILGFYGQ